MDFTFNAESRDVWNIFFLISVRFRFFENTRIPFRMSLVRFGSKKLRFGLDIIVIYYLCNSKYYSDSGWHDFDVTHNNDNK